MSNHNKITRGTKKPEEIKTSKEMEDKLEHILEGTNPNEKKEESSDILGIGEISKQLTEKDKIKFLTNLSPDSANNVSILYALNTILGSELLDVYLENTLITKTSINGKRADQIIQVGKNLGMSLALALGGNNNLMGDDKKNFLQRIRDKT